MSKPMRSASIIRGYAWWLIRENLDWSVDTYGGRVPIVPFSDEPAYKVTEKPYIVYGWAETINTKDHRITEGNLSFSIRSKQLSDISLVTRVLVEGFKREDESARDVNQFSSDVDDYFNGITFTCTEIAYIEPGAPEDTDEGWTEGIVTVRYEYIDEFGDDPDMDGIKLRTANFSR